MLKRGRVKVFEVYDWGKLEVLDFIVSQLKSRGVITSIDISRHLGISVEKAREMLNLFREAGVLCEIKEAEAKRRLLETRLRETEKVEMWGTKRLAV